MMAAPTQRNPIVRASGGLCRAGVRAVLRHAAPFVVIVSVALAATHAAAAIAPPDANKPILKPPALKEGRPDPAKIQIEEKLQSQVPLDAKLTTHDGREVSFGELIGNGKPTLLSLGYFECPMLCDVVLNGVLRGMKTLDFTPGNQFNIVSISIEPKETAQLAANKRKSYLTNYGREVPDGAWTFATGAASETKRIADAVGWNYQWDPEEEQYAHAAGVFILTPEGKVSRVLYGIMFESRDLKFALMEAGQGRVGSALEKLVLWCFHYDPQDRTYVIFAVRVMRVGGALTLLALASFVGLLWRADRRKQRNQVAAGT